MLAKETGAATTFDLPEEVLQVLPSDPFEQLDVARKITSIALSTRVSALESESSALRANLAEKDSLIAELQSQIESLDSSLSDTSDKLAQAQLEKDNLIRDNAALTHAVRKLQRDVSKLEVFRKTLMQSLKEDDESSTGAPIAKPTPNDDTANLPSRTPMRSQFSEAGNSSFAEDREQEPSRPGISHGMLLVSQTSTPRLTPPGSPPSLSASVSPTRTSKPVSPRRHSISFSTSRGMFDDRSSMFSSAHGSVSGSDSASQTGRTRVDGKEFFRQVRSRLSYEQFGAFLANVKELNAHKQTKEETLRKADEIFGPDNKDLYAIFEGLITRNVH
ncbi:PH-response transcription factor pacC [Melia azedarach]|uniref:PH-response transcription factor pacC n=1 Tax=Melia azedarach TaxID=155640 RepID=A0ACC1YFJ1_MELAZ|nr:PH-response transcription factor pacC [Melia azedarach]